MKFFNFLSSVIVTNAGDGRTPDVDGNPNGLTGPVHYKVSPVYVTDGRTPDADGGANDELPDFQIKNKNY